MVLAYAFADERGVMRGEPGDERPQRFTYVPPTGPFAGQKLTVFAAPWDDQPSTTWLQASTEWGCFATVPVARLLALDSST